MVYVVLLQMLIYCHGVCRVVADDDLFSWCVSLTVMVCVVVLQMMIQCHGVCHGLLRCVPCCCR